MSHKLRPHQSATQKQLKRVIEVITSLSKKGAPVVNLFGGFFSVAQARVGGLQDKLCGVCHGLEYGESKPVIPVSGGIPVAKFYFNNLHFRLPSRVAYQEITAKGALDSEKKYHATICECDECKKHIVNSPRKEFVQAYGQAVSKSVWRSGQWVTMQFPTAEVSDHCTRHYMWCKTEEYSQKFTKSGIKSRLQQAHRDLEPHLGADYAGHTNAWAQLF